MDKNSSNNIFDEASKKGKGQPSKETAIPRLADTSSKLNTPPQNQDLTEIDTQMLFDRVRELQKDLDEKKAELHDTIATSPTQVIQFFNDPKNFSIDQWNIIQNNRSDLEKKVWALLGKDPNKVREKQIEDQKEKSRKAKSLGTRHNWIPIR